MEKGEKAEKTQREKVSFAGRGRFREKSWGLRNLREDDALSIGKAYLMAEGWGPGIVKGRGLEGTKDIKKQGKKLQPS